MPPILGAAGFKSRLAQRCFSKYVGLEEVVEMIPRPLEVKARKNFRIWLRYDDGTQGEVDLSDVAGQGVFAAWNDVAFFNSVRLGSHGAIEWGENLDICPDAMYLRLTGESPEDVFPALKSVHADA
jgi:hypothetical protein